MLDVGRIREGDDGRRCRVRLVRWGASPVRSARSKAAARSASRADLRSAAGLPKTLASTRPSITSPEDVGRALREHAPDGVDVFFDNVGGEILDTVLTQLARGARIVLSGGVSQYAPDQVRGPSNYLSLIGARASMIGFLTPDYAERYPQARAELADVAPRGPADLAAKTSSRAVFGAFPDALPKLFAGENIGQAAARRAVKQVILDDSLTHRRWRASSPYGSRGLQVGTARQCLEILR